MTLLCQLQMTLPGGFPGGVRGDGSADERSGACAARGAAGFGSVSADDRGGGAAAGARAPSGIPAVEGLPQRGPDWFDFEAPRSLQQPAKARGSSHQGAVDHSRALLGFRPDFGGREAARGTWNNPRSRDIATMDDRGRAVARSQAAAEACPSAALPAGVRRRAGSGRRRAGCPRCGTARPRRC